MIKEIGRLNGNEELEIKNMTEKALQKLEKSQKSGKTAFEKLASCKNYFGRISIAKVAASSPLKDKVAKITIPLLDSKNYAKRATALYFFFYYYFDEPEKMIEIVSSYYHSIKWEAENIMDHFWKGYPKLMKANMLKWIESPDEKKRSLSFHGLENISQKDPQFVLEFIEKIIDDDSIEVQKKITHTLIQIARIHPADVYPHLMEWLRDADEKRMKTIWVSMKRLANTVINSRGKEQNADLTLLTKETIKNWKSDKNPHISEMGKKLFKIIKNKKNHSDIFF